MIGYIKIHQEKRALGTNRYTFKFDENALDILDTQKLEVNISKGGLITLFKPSLTTKLVYNIKVNNTIKASTNDAYIDIEGNYYIHAEEDDSLGFELIKI